MAILNFVLANKVVLLGAALALSEVMALVPGVPSGIIASIISAIKALQGPQV